MEYTEAVAYTYLGHSAQDFRHFTHSPGQNWTDWTNAPNLSSILSNPVQP